MELKQIIAENISSLRREIGMTQAELAEKLNYTDKAVSKWERGESIPDVGVLKEIADLFEVKVDYLLVEDHSDSAPEELTPRKRRDHMIISLLSVSLVWLIATFLFVLLRITNPDTNGIWLTFVYAIPVTMIVALVFNSMWGKPRRNYLLITILVWSLLASVYLSYSAGLMWMVFLLGIPAQIIIMLWSRLGKG